MNIKIKATGVACLIGGDYGRIYSSLKKQFGEGTEQLFSERTPGNNYLQWELPGEGWKSLADGDPLMASEVKKELERRSDAVRSRFRANLAMADNVLSVPDDSYVYYKADEQGQLFIRLTAWGYRYPERIGGSEIGGNISEMKETVPMTIRVVCNGKGVPYTIVKVNGYNRTTDNDGVIDLGQLPLGYRFDVEMEGDKRNVIVGTTENNIVFDIVREDEEVKDVQEEIVQDIAIPIEVKEDDEPEEDGEPEEDEDETVEEVKEEDDEVDDKVDEVDDKGIDAKEEEKIEEESTNDEVMTKEEEEEESEEDPKEKKEELIEAKEEKSGSSIIMLSLLILLFIILSVATYIFSISFLF